MSRLLAYIANDPQRIRCALNVGRDALRVAIPTSPGDPAAAPHTPPIPTPPVDSWGLGFHQGGEVLLQRRPRPADGPLDFYQLLGDLRSDVLVGHMRRATVGLVKHENTHPFRFRQWIFAHHGTVGGSADRFASSRDRILGHIPDFLRRNIRGETDSEHLFHLFLAQLHRAGKLDDALVPSELAGQALAEAVGLCDVAVGGSDWVANCAASNGRVMLATARGAAVHHYQVSGIHDCPVCRESPAEASRAAARPYEHDHLRAVVLLADDDLAAPRAPWHEIPPGSLITVSHELQLRVTPLGA